MRKLLRDIILNTIVFFIIARFSTLLSTTGIRATFIAALTFSLIVYLTKPMFNLLWLPINLLSLGLLSWVPLTFCLILSILLTSGFDLHNLIIPQLNLGPIHTPNIHFGMTSSIVVLTFLYFLTKRIIRWVTK